MHTHFTIALPKLGFDLLADRLTHLASNDSPARLTGSDVATIRRLLNACETRLNDEDDAPEADELLNILTIVRQAIAAATCHLETARAIQEADPSTKITSTDLACITLYDLADALETDTLEALGDDAPEDDDEEDPDDDIEDDDGDTDEDDSDDELEDDADDDNSEDEELGDESNLDDSDYEDSVDHNNMEAVNPSEVPSLGGTKPRAQP